MVEAFLCPATSLRSFALTLLRNVSNQGDYCYLLTGQSHGNSGNMEQQLHLELWKGNLGNALNICKEKGELNEMVVAMSPLGALKLDFDEDIFFGGFGNIQKQNL